MLSSQRLVGPNCPTYTTYIIYVTTHGHFFELTATTCSKHEKSQFVKIHHIMRKDFCICCSCCFIDALLQGRSIRLGIQLAPSAVASRSARRPNRRNRCCLAAGGSGRPMGILLVGNPCLFNILWLYAFLYFLIPVLV